MRTHIFAIGIFSDRLEVGLCRRGRIIDVRKRDVALDASQITSPEAWMLRVRELGGAVRGMVAELCMGVSSPLPQSNDPGESAERTPSKSTFFQHRAIVVYESPTAIADCYGLVLPTASQAQQAAKLAATDAFPTPDDVVTASLLVEQSKVTDPDTREPSSNTPRGGKRSHVIAVAESEELVESIQTMVTRAGLSFAGAIPASAVIASSAVLKLPSAIVSAAANAPSETQQAEEPASETTADTAITALLHVEEHGSFLVIRDRRGQSTRSRGTLRFTRSISLGTHSLAIALQQQGRTEKPATPHADDVPKTISSIASIDNAEASDDPGHLTLDKARHALFEFGLPDPSQPEQLTAVHQPTRLTGRDILPLVQPHLQRATVELRQSLRFALEPAERSRVRLVISEPGGGVPGLVEALARELELPVCAEKQTSSAAAKPYDSATPASLLTTMAAANGSWFGSSPAATAIQTLTLEPREQAMRSTVGRARQALWAGAAAAILLIALDASRLHNHLSKSQDAAIASEALTASKLISESAGHIPPKRPEDMIAVIETGQKFRRALETELGQQVNLRAALQELSLLTPESVRFTTLALYGRSRDSLPYGTIGGVARDRASDPARAELDRFLQHLRTSPLFDEVSLSNVQATQDADGRARRFNIRMEVVGARTSLFNVNNPEPPDDSIAAVGTDQQGGSR